MSKTPPKYMTVEEMIDRYEDKLLLVSVARQGKSFESGEVVMIGEYNRENYHQAYELLYKDLDGKGYIYVAVRDGGEILHDEIYAAYSVW